MPTNSKSNIEIIPTIIPKSFSDLKEKLVLVKGLVLLVQIDISDGIFTENKTWPFRGRPTSAWTSDVQEVSDLDPDFIKIVKEEEEFPFWEDLEFEVHLMINDPSSMIQQWISAGAKRILIHYESYETPDKIAKFCQEFQKNYGGEGLVNIELGVVLNLETEIQVLEPLIPHINFVQLMSIAKIGFQGIGIQFEPVVLEKIRDLRSAYPNLPISIDGGINLENAKNIIAAGANRLAIGGAIFQSNDIGATIKEFQNLGV